PSGWRPYSPASYKDDKVIRLRLTRLSGDGSHLRQQIALLWKEGDPHFAFEEFLNLQYIEDSLWDLGIRADGPQGLTNYLWPHRLGLGELDSSLALGAAGYDTDPVGAVLLDCRRHLPQAVDYLFLNLFYHVAVAKMDFPDIDRTQPVAPLDRFG